MNLYECTLKTSGGGGGGGGTGNGASLIVTCDSSYAGTTITCTNGSTSFTETCPSTSPYTVTFADIPPGTWNVSGTSGGTTVTTTITVTDFALTLYVIPDGATVTPTDDIQTWLHCANINKSYTTVSQVLADSTTLNALITDSNAVDYMARSTTWASSVCANSSAMTAIGNNDYCATALLTNSTWRTAICNSSYFESVLKTKVPTMTSDTTPSGQVISANIYTSNPAYYAFDGNANTCGAPTAVGSPFYIGYKFTSPVCVNKVLINCRAGYTKTVTYYIQASNDNSTWTSFSNDLNMTAGNTNYNYIVENTTKYQYYRIYTANLQGSTQGFNTIQFYGRT